MGSILKRISRPALILTFLATVAAWGVVPALARAEENTLLEVMLGRDPTFTRLVFTFQKPLESYVLRRDDVDRLILDFGRARTSQPPPATPADDLVTGIELKTVEGRLTAEISLSTVRYQVRHFASRDKYNCVVDLSPLDSAAPEPAADPEALKPLTAPTLAELAGALESLFPPQNVPDQAENLLRRVLGRLKQGSVPGALDDLNLFKELFPQHQAREYVDYLAAEAAYLAGPPEETHRQAVEQWKDFLDRWPDSILVPRARFMLAEADRALGQQNEAAAQFKIIAAEALSRDDPYARLALLRAADLLLNMGLIDEARSVLDPVLQRGRGDRLGLEAYARWGLADFYQGYFSQANEIFHEALRLAPNLHQTFPEMLYAAGEGYHYLGRPDLSTSFLLHGLNLMPKHPKADVILARIGDNYRHQGRDREAMAVYGAAQRNHPNSDGGLISQVRLADMGALHSFFSQDKVFDALERGARLATVEMYKKIVETGSTSPLMQLAQLKIGTALAEEGENSEAVKWLRDLEINNPKSALLPEAMPTLNQALVEEILTREQLEDWKGITDLYADNSSYLSPQDRDAILRVVAKAFERQGRPAEALDVWQQIEETDPERRRARYQGLAGNSLKSGRPLQAAEYLAEMLREFPGEKPWVELQMAQAGRDLARPQNAQATENLLRLTELTDLEPVRRDALADAATIEINSQRYDRARELMDRYRRQYPDDELTPEYLLTEARIADREKDPDRAWDLLSEFRLRYPDDPRVPGLLLDQIEQAEKLGRVDDVLRFMELYRAHFPQSREGRDMLAARMDREWNLGRYPEARESLAAYLRDYPDDPAAADLLIKRAGQAFDQGRHEEADWATGQLVEKYRDDPRTVSFLLDQADRQWRAQLYDQAQSSVDRLNRLYPGNPRVADLMYGRIAAEWERGRTAPARRAADDFRRRFPDDPRVGQSYLDEYRYAVASGQPDLAAEVAGEFRAARPRDSQAQASLLLEEAKDLLAAGRPAEALGKWNDFRRRFPQDPRNRDLLLIQARQELKAGRGPDASDHFRQFIGQYPEDDRTPDVYLEAAAAEGSLGRLQGAWELLDRFKSLYPDHPARPQALLDQAELGPQIGRGPQAAALYELFRRDYPDHPQSPGAYLAQARLEADLGEPLAAIETLETGVLAEPALDRDQQVQALLTDLYLETGRVMDWAELTERNLDREENPQADLPGRFLKYNQLAQVNQELGRTAQAVRNYDSALANRPPDASPETIYAIAGAYKKLQQPDKYASTLNLLRNSGQPFWQKIAEDELAGLEGGTS